ncbi:MAG: AraC family transcriptional regulator [Verrucomicrobiales bacterium]|nr:AraC family transcriptional regulator [Verrucomicrobiales bacterium]
MRAVFEKIDSEQGSCFSVRKIEQRAFDAPWHFHPECELTYIIEGEGERFVGDSMESFTAGDFVLLGAELPHFWSSSKAGVGVARAVVVHFGESFLGDALQGAAEFASIRELLSLAKRGCCFSQQRQLSLALGERIQDLLQATGLQALLILIEILQSLAEAGDATDYLSSVGHEPLRDQKSGQRINRAYQYVYANLDGEVTLDAVAQVAGMSPAAFSRYFKRMTGRNLSDFIGELRTSQACKLLRETNSGVAEVAYEVGFGSLSNFNRLFKQLKGMSPREWRRRGLIIDNEILG